MMHTFGIAGTVAEPASLPYREFESLFPRQACMPRLCRLIVVVAKYLRPSLSVAELGREAIPCKDWPSAIASGG